MNPDLLAPIGHGHEGPPASFIITLAHWARFETPEVFAVNSNPDIYSLMLLSLGPYTSLLHRKAVLCEVLRVLPGDESDWDWTEGRDTTAGSQREEEKEAGAFQVSYDSIHLGLHLKEFLESHGIHNAIEFQSKIKADPILDLQYVARLLREPYKRWDGPINRGWIAQQVSRKAVQAFMTLLS